MSSINQPPINTTKLLRRNLNRLLQERQLTRRALSLRSGISLALVCRLTAGDGNPTLQTLSALASAFGVPVADLLRRDQDVARDVQRLFGFMPDTQAFLVRRWSKEALARSAKARRSTTR